MWESVLLMQSFDSYLYGSQSFFLTVINILWNSSSRRTSELNSNLSRNVSLHNSEIICIRFVTGIQYEKSFLCTGNTFDLFFSEVLFARNVFDKRLSSENNQFYKFTGIYVSGLSGRKSDFCHCSYWWSDLWLSQWYHPYLSYDFILFM